MTGMGTWAVVGGVGDERLQWVELGRLRVVGRTAGISAEPDVKDRARIDRTGWEADL
jgi:hypothetical protein